MKDLSYAALYELIGRQAVEIYALRQRIASLMTDATTAEPHVHQPDHPLEVA